MWLWGIHWGMGNRPVVTSPSIANSSSVVGVAPEAPPPRWDFLLLVPRSCASLTFSTFSRTEATGTAVDVFTARQ